MLVQSFSAIPPGAMISYGGAQAPEGWLICDGTAKLRASYPDLFIAIGTSYGAGDGSTTFNVPDAKGRALIGASSAYVVGSNDGLAEANRLQKVPKHYHSVGAGAALTAAGQSLGTTNVTSGLQTATHGHSPSNGQSFVTTGGNQAWVGNQSGFGFVSGTGVETTNHNHISDIAHAHQSSSVTGTIGLVTGGADGNTDQALPYLTANLIIKY